MLKLCKLIEFYFITLFKVYNLTLLPKFIFKADFGNAKVGKMADKTSMKMTKDKSIVHSNTFILKNMLI